MNMKVDIQYKGNTSFKLTITSNNEVRIKVQDDCDMKMEDVMIENLLRFADRAIKRGWNTVTLRGKVKAGDDRLSLYTDKKDIVCHFFIIYTYTKSSFLHYVFNHNQKKNPRKPDNELIWVVNRMGKPIDFDLVFEEFESAASYADDIGSKDFAVMAICKSGLDDFISEYYKDRRAWHDRKEKDDDSILEEQIENETNRLFYLNREKQMAEEKARDLGNIDPTEALYQRCRAQAIANISTKDS